MVLVLQVVLVWGWVCGVRSVMVVVVVLMVVVVVPERRMTRSVSPEHLSTSRHPTDSFILPAFSVNQFGSDWQWLLAVTVSSGC